MNKMNFRNPADAIYLVSFLINYNCDYNNEDYNDIHISSNGYDVVIEWEQKREDNRYPSIDSFPCEDDCKDDDPLCEDDDD